MEILAEFLVARLLDLVAIVSHLYCCLFPALKFVEDCRRHHPVLGRLARVDSGEELVVRMRTATFPLSG